MCLDVLRALAKEPESCQIVMKEIEEAKGSDSRLDAVLDGLESHLTRLQTGGKESMAQARAVVDTLAVALQGSILVRYGNSTVAEAFCASRLNRAERITANYGTLPISLRDCQTIASRFYGGTL